MNGASIFLFNKIIEQVLTLARQGNIEKADELTRSFVRKIYYEEVKNWDLNRKISFIENVTGGLGFRFHNICDMESMVHVGMYISWADVVKDGYSIFEIGTGLGRTMYCIFLKAKPSLYVSCDINPYMLAIALFDNPVSEFQEILWKSCVKILLCDGVRLAYALPYSPNHVVHDGGPCPRDNPRLYADHFIKRLIEITKQEGTLSIFAGKDRWWVNKIYNVVKSVELIREVRTVSVPGSGICVIHVRRK